MQTDKLLFEVTGNLACITLNRPEAANGMDLDMMRALCAAATECDQRSDVRAVLISANGKMFSAGGDLKSFLDAGDNVGTLLQQMTIQFHAAVSIFNRMDAPVVTAVNGMAAGGGLSFALSGDVIFAAQSARFTLAYTAAGLSPDGSSSYFLPRLIGMRRAKELMLTNRVVSADEALQYGMIDRIVADDALFAEAEKQALAFANGPTKAYGAVKSLLNASFGESLESQMELEARSINALAQGADGREGVTAFGEKRKPDFKGQS